MQTQSHQAVNNTLAALADPTRRSIVELLVQRPHRATELAEITGTSRSRMSKHLRVLLDAGITRDERPIEDARARIFHLQPDSIRDIRAWLDQLQRQWDAQLQSFKRHVQQRTEKN